MVILKRKAMGRVGATLRKAMHGPDMHRQYRSVWPLASQQVVLAGGKCGGSAVGIWCNAEVLVLMARGRAYLSAGEGASFSSSLESRSSWVETKDSF